MLSIYLNTRFLKISFWMATYSRNHTTPSCMYNWCILFFENWAVILKMKQVGGLGNHHSRKFYVDVLRNHRLLYSNSCNISVAMMKIRGLRVFVCECTDCLACVVPSAIFLHSTVRTYTLDCELGLSSLKTGKFCLYLCMKGFWIFLIS